MRLVALFASLNLLSSSVAAAELEINSSCPTPVSPAALLHLLFDGSYCLKDRGQRGGIFLNGKKIVKQAVEDGDVITFGLDGSYQIVFRTSASSATVRSPPFADRRASPPVTTRLGVSAGSTSCLKRPCCCISQLPLDAVLGTMLDHAMAVTDAERGILLEADQSGSLRMRLARGHKRVPIPPEKSLSQPDRGSSRYAAPI